MIATILNLLGGLTRLAVSLIGLFERRRLIDGARARVNLENLQGQINACKIALAAREAVRADVARHPDRLPADDPFRRD
jgi:hypothetical protein